MPIETSVHPAVTLEILDMVQQESNNDIGQISCHTRILILIRNGQWEQYYVPRRKEELRGWTV